MNGSGVRWTQLRVGLAVTGALAILAAAILIIGETGRIFGERYALVTLMPNASGLTVGSGVRLAGQDVGKVASIEFVPIEERQQADHVIRISLAIDRSVQEHIRGDTEARIRTLGLLGDKIIDLTPGGAEAAVLEAGDTIGSAAALDYEQMLTSAFTLVDDLAVMLRNVRSIADSLLAGRGTAGQLLMDTSLYVELLNTSRSMNDFLTAVGSSEGALAQIAQDEALYQDLRSVIGGLDSLTATLISGEGTLSRLLSDETLYQNLLSASSRADSLLFALESGEGALGQLMTDQELYESMLKLLVDVQKVVTELREDPSKYIPPIRVF